ncbi:MAG: type I pullulanase [Streptococcaceae bacterium]|nr:type I pullulanase [Streptococcaceae bacterium]
MKTQNLSRVTRLHTSKSHYRSWKSGKTWLYASTALAALTFTAATPEVINQFTNWTLVAAADTIAPSVQVNYTAPASQTTAPYAYVWGTGTTADGNFNNMTLATGTTNQYQTTIPDVKTPTDVGVIVTTTNDWSTAQKLNGDVNGDGTAGDDIKATVATGTSEQININSAGLPTDKSYNEISITVPTITTATVNQAVNLSATINNPSQLTPSTGLSISVNGAALTTDPSQFTPTSAGTYTVDYSYGYTSPNEGKVTATKQLIFNVAAANQATLQVPITSQIITLPQGQTETSYTPAALSDSSRNPTNITVFKADTLLVPDKSGTYSLPVGTYTVQYMGQDTAPAFVRQTLTIAPAPDAVSAATLNVHFYNPAGYTDWNIWKWVDGNGASNQFSGTTTIDGNTWNTGTLKYDTSATDGNAKANFNKVNLIIRQSVAGNDWAAQTSDLSVSPNLDGSPKDIYIVSGVNKVFQNSTDAMAAFARGNIDYAAFDKQWGYDGALGAIYSPNSTTYKVWAPTTADTGISKVQLVDYGTNTSPTAPALSTYDMVQGKVSNPDNHTLNTVGLWTLTRSGDQKNTVYAYKVTYQDGTSVLVEDPYTVATILNGTRSVVVNPADTIPAGFSVKQGAEATWRVSSPTDAIIQEMNIRDFTISASSGVDKAIRGKYLGVIQTGTKNAAGNPTGLDYLKKLGINYVEVMPTADFANDETKDEQNWGYNPLNYNVPEGSYSTNAANPLTRVTEMKQMVQGLHNAGIGVIMDVVYPHVANVASSPFQVLTPDYYFRKSNGSGMGNDTASEREMYSNYIVNSLLGWVNNYNIDGFRFDQMMNIDVNTMNSIRAKLNAIDPNILLYGEGWNGSSTALPKKQLSDQNNIQEIPGIGVFNDIARDAIKGSDVYSKTDPKTGFVNESTTNNVFDDTVAGVADVITGTQKAMGEKSIPALTPSQIFNFVEVHDNATLNDLIWKQNPTDTQVQHNLRVNLANAINLLSAGSTIMETGQEFDRTKVVDANNNGKIDDSEWEAAVNSYNAGDTVNSINWNLAGTNSSMVKFIQDVITFKKTNPSFTLPTFNEINASVKITNQLPGSGLITYEVTQGKQKFLVVYNASGKVVSLGQGSSSLAGLNNYATTDFTEAEVEVSDSTGLISGQKVASKTLALSDLSATIIRLAQDFTVSFNSNGGNRLSNLTIVEGEKVNAPATPSKSGYTFSGWYADSQLTQAYNFAQTVISDLTLYAKWSNVAPTPSSEISQGSSKAKSASNANPNSSTASSPASILPRTGENLSEATGLEALGIYALLISGSILLNKKKKYE